MENLASPFRTYKCVSLFFFWKCSMIGDSINWNVGKYSGYLKIFEGNCICTEHIQIFFTHPYSLNNSVCNLDIVFIIPGAITNLEVIWRIWEDVQRLFYSRDRASMDFSIWWGSWTVHHISSFWRLSWINTTLIYFRYFIS